VNSYGDVSRLKSASYLNYEGTAEDTRFRLLLEAASRLIDAYTNRFFYVKETTRYFDGGGAPLFLKDDLLSVTTLKTDDDGDATYENTFATTDYILYPLNDYPKTIIKLTHDSDYGSFAGGIRKGIEIEGDFGYGDGESATPYSLSGSSTNETSDMTTTQTTMIIDDGTDFGIGQTIRLEDEQCYITGISTNTLTIKRGVNGTTAATHSTQTFDITVYIYDYPEPIEQACLIQAMRWWKRKDTAFMDVVVSPDIGGGITYYKGLDPDIKLILSQYKKRNI